MPKRSVLQQVDEPNRGQLDKPGYLENGPKTARVVCVYIHCTGLV